MHSTTYIIMLCDKNKTIQHTVSYTAKNEDIYDNVGPKDKELPPTRDDPHLVWVAPVNQQSSSSLEKGSALCGYR